VQRGSSSGTGVVHLAVLFSIARGLTSFASMTPTLDVSTRPLRARTLSYRPRIIFGFSSRRISPLRRVGDINCIFRAMRTSCASERAAVFFHDTCARIDASTVRSLKPNSPAMTLFACPALSNGEYMRSRVVSASTRLVI